MGAYSIAEAKNQLSKLVDAAIAGEDVVITRHGKPVAELRPTRGDKTGRLSADLIERIAERARTLPALGEPSADIIRRMRDDEP